MAQCRVIIGKEMDPVTGEVTKIIDVDPYVENKHNTCPHFIKRFFAKKNEKRYCVDCKNMFETTISMGCGQ